MTITFYDENGNTENIEYNVIETLVDSKEKTLYWTTIDKYGEIKRHERLFRNPPRLKIKF